MESKTYLLVFSVLLTYYSYLCNICEKMDAFGCGSTAGYDDEGIYKCTYDDSDSLCYRSKVEGTISSCESAIDEIKNILKLPFDFIFDTSSCEKINNNFIMSLMKDMKIVI